jgi:hypothetical protein
MIDLGWAVSVGPGLNTLLKNSDSQAKFRKYVPQGLKPGIVLLRLRHG